MTRQEDNSESRYAQEGIFKEEFALSAKLKNDTKFDSICKTDEARCYSVSGTITPTRDAIENLVVTFYNDNDPNCREVEMTGGTLELKK